MNSSEAKLCINTIRTLVMDAIQNANSGHPGAPIGLAPAAYVLWTQLLKHNPQNPQWSNRDRFVLSGGHASMLLYSMLHLSGYDVSLNDIRNFRQMGSKTPGHPEYGITPGVETTTGPLGQGFANAVGLAMSECHLAARFNRPGCEVIDHYTFVMCGDGDLMEGISYEAASLAGHLNLGKLICIYDDNRISIEGSTEITFTENIATRFEACGWDAIIVRDGNDIYNIYKAIEAARTDTTQPTIILLRTHIAYGCPNKQDTADAHGAPLGAEEIQLTKQKIDWPLEQNFYIPEEVPQLFKKSAEAGKQHEAEWQQKMARYQEEYPQESAQLHDALAGKLPQDWESSIPSFTPEQGSMATRGAFGKILNQVAARVPALIGGSADLAPSNKTLIENSFDFAKPDYKGRNIRFGVREHAMGSILSGIALHGGLRPFAGTFFVFADYMRPAIRLAALMKLPVIYIFTHDSIAVGEDGPTHQPVEHLFSLRAIPGLTVIRPGDANETAKAWQMALQNSTGPYALILTRQKLPILDRKHYASADNLVNGAYILEDCTGKPDLILIATGSEIHISLRAAEILTAEGIAVRTVSMPSWELFDQKDRTYRESVLPAGIPCLAVEAGLSLGWERFVGHNGAVIGMDSFGASAPGDELLKKFGFFPENIVTQAKILLNK